MMMLVCLFVFLEIVYTRASAVNVNGTGEAESEADYPKVVVQKVLDRPGRNTGVIIFSPLAQKPDCATSTSEMVRFLKALAACLL